ncbi:hypothetical protein [Rhodococcus sp. OK302]|jgi:hypothetical protein|uniref:hypothetical protein n=1 Tax=Rhodococcus sp. OK302 TaxID=1882769 RepID=UPI000B9F47DD|nr:hypothetical protein [Rhodococcus sp. OK302]OYD60828.1 hypothetical protein BDB13_5719 [Rhodococcus sp. OK302]
MRTFATQHQRLILPILLTAVLVVAGTLWWTKTIAFTRTALVTFSVTSSQASDGAYHAEQISISPTDLSETAERVAHTRGGTAADYQPDLTITPAAEVAGMSVTARGRTPGAAQSLANDGAEALRSYLVQSRNATSTSTIAFTVITPGT